MATGVTSIVDVIVPTHFAPYVIERTAELSVFFRSGIVATDSEFDEMASMGGTILNMPFWQDIKDPSQVINDTTRLNVLKIVAANDQCITHNRGNAWSANDLAKYLSGDDPLGAIEDLVAEYWARDMEFMLLSSLAGIFGAASMSTNTLDIHADAAPGALTSANFLTGETYINGKFLLGDNAEKLVAIAMHSATEAALLKLDLIDFIPQSEGKPDLKKFQGLTVITDDHLTVTQSGTGGNAPWYTTILFGEGAFALGVDRRAGDAVVGGFGTWAVELGRDPLGNQTNLINRKRFILHPRGVRFTNNTVAAPNPSPTNTELGLAVNWQRVYESKNVRMVRIVHNNLPNRKAALS
jgi:hypothetical protein